MVNNKEKVKAKYTYDETGVVIYGKHIHTTMVI